ncbi:MAG TPA: oligosaccharide flippase family protein [Candidatus Woesebacteria bacterium]|nr:oligosaccharide flippase family protein [Candidatus Woesebacteria bacterium]
MSSDLDVNSIKDKSTSGVLFLTIRNIGIQSVSVLGYFILTIILGTSEVGLFAIVAESISILGYFSDIGLAAALIQKKETPSKKEFDSTFTFQQLLVSIGLVVVSLVFFNIYQQKSYGTKELFIFISLCFSFFVGSLKTIPSVILERELDFKLLSTVDIIENIIFYSIAVLFAFLGFSTNSYAIAVFIRSLIGLIIIYKKTSYRPQLNFSFTSLKQLFKFGIPYQANSFIAVAKDKISNLFVAAIIGREGFGILSWSQKGPRIPLSFMDSIMKVSFPVFSRLQHDPENLRRSLTRTLSIISLIIFPALTIISLVSSNLIYLIPKYSKWSPAIIPLYLFCLNNLIAAVTTPLTNSFNAVGKITLTSKFMIMWTVLTWIFYPLLSFRYGFLGTAIASVIVSSSSIIVWYYAHKIFNINVFKIITPYLLGSLIILFLGILFKIIINQLLVQIILILLFCPLFYFVFIYFADRHNLLWLYTQIQTRLKQK